MNRLLDRHFTLILDKKQALGVFEQKKTALVLATLFVDTTSRGGLFIATCSPCGYMPAMGRSRTQRGCGERCVV